MGEPPEPPEPPPWLSPGWPLEFVGDSLEEPPEPVAVGLKPDVVESVSVGSLLPPPVWVDPEVSLSLVESLDVTEAVFVGVDAPPPVLPGVVCVALVPSEVELLSSVVDEVELSDSESLVADELVLLVVVSSLLVEDGEVVDSEELVELVPVGDSVVDSLVLVSLVLVSLVGDEEEDDEVSLIGGGVTDEVGPPLGHKFNIGRNPGWTFFSKRPNPLSPSDESIQHWRHSPTSCLNVESSLQRFRGSL